MRRMGTLPPTAQTAQMRLQQQQQQQQQRQHLQMQQVQQLQQARQGNGGPPLPQAGGSNARVPIPQRQMGAQQYVRPFGSSPVPALLC